MRRSLTKEWSIDLDETFVGRTVGADLQLMSLGPPVRTLWVSIHPFPPEQPVAEAMRMVRAEANPDPLERFEEPGADADELRYASWYPETDPDGREQWALYAYTVRPGRIVALAIISDAPDDKPWALGAWRSLQHGPH